MFGKVEVQSQVSSFVTRGSGAIRSSYIAPKPLGADDTKAKDAASKDGKILSRPPRFPLALTQNVPEHASKKPADAGAPFRFGLRVDGAPTAVHAATVGRPRRVTRRVSGSRTPQPYQRRRRGQGAIDDHVLQVPGKGNGVRELGLACMALLWMAPALNVDKCLRCTDPYFS